MKIAILGGAGELGTGLALNWARQGHDIVIGSRSKEKAESFAQEMKVKFGDIHLEGKENIEAIKGASLVVLAIPGVGRKPFLESIRLELDGKVVLDVTIPLKPGKIFLYDPPGAGSNAQETQDILGDRVKVVAGFHTVSAGLLKMEGGVPSEHVLIVGNDEGAKEIVISLIEEMGMRGFDAGPLAFAPVIEGLTPMIINLNKKYKRKHIGIRLSGI